VSQHRSPEQSNVALLILAIVLAGVFVLTVVAAVGVIRNTPGPTVSVAQVDLPTVAAAQSTSILRPAQIAAAPVSHPAVVHVTTAHSTRHAASRRHAVRHHTVKHHHRHPHHRHDRHRSCP
jgi:hypothetical protein